ncbi:MAG: nucleotidyltransferase domain-containing protein [bacterium]|nr:nucleotidyltransferase domain-containing protein [bacterium]
METENKIITEINKDEIISLSKIHPSRVKAIYMFGSRVYGTNRPDSDYDIILVGSSMNEATELKGEKYNIHIHTPDKFKRDLYYHDVHSLECVYAPESAVIFETEKYPFKLDKSRLKKSFLSASHNSWLKAKNRIIDCDVDGGVKSAFHSIRILMFGIQIANSGRIDDFSAANHIWKSMDEFEESYEWTPFKENFLPDKIKLEESLKQS